MTTYAELAQLDRAAREASVALAKARAALADAVASGAPTGDLLAAQRAVEHWTQLVAVTAGSRDAAVAASTAQLDPLVPMLMLPVRLETKYGRDAGGAILLRIRLYPDDIHFDSHQPDLTQRELDAAAIYRSSMTPRVSAADALAAWATLARNVGPSRVEWVAAATSGGSSPRTAVGLWTRAEQAALLPDAWVATAWRGDHPIATSTSAVIARPLHVGPDPSLPSGSASDPGMLWMTDFATALATGMALEMVLPDDGPIDVLTVVGARGTDSVAIGSASVARLLTGHRYTVGLDLLEPGTPTNNLPGAPSGLGSSHPTGTDSFVDPTVPVQPWGADGVALAAALGMPVSDLPPVAHSELAATAREQDMATALWPATWGYFLQQMLRLQVDADPAKWRSWMLENLRGGGPLPALRVGKQPYGILPLTPLDDWRPPGTSSAMVLAERTAGRPGLRGGGARTMLRLLDEIDDTGGWTAEAPLGEGPPPPAGSTGITLATTDLSGRGRTTAVFGYTGMPVDPAVGIVCPVGTLSRDGFTASGHVAIPIDPQLRKPVLSGLALAFTSFSTRARTAEGESDLVVVAQLLEGGGGPPLTFLSVGRGMRDGGGPPKWSSPVEVSGIFAIDETVQAITAVRVGDAVKLVVVAGTDVVTAPGAQMSYRLASEVDVNATVNGGWTPASPVGVVFNPGVVSVGVSLPRVQVAGRTRIAMAQAFTVGGSVNGVYAVSSGLEAGTRVKWSNQKNLGNVPAATSRVAVAGVSWPRVRTFERSLTTASGPANVLAHLKAVWLGAAGQPVRAGVGDPTRDLLNVLSSEAVSIGYDARGFLGDGVLRSMARVLDPNDQPGPPTSASGVVDFLSSQVGVAVVGAEDDHAATPVGSRVLRGRFLDHASRVSVPFVASGDELDAPVGWLAEMIKAKPQELHDQLADVKAPLLARLLRYSLLRAYGESAYLLKPPATSERDPPLQEPEFVDMTDYSARDTSHTGHTATSWRYLSEQQGTTGTLAEEIYAEVWGASPRAWATPVVDVLNALKGLGKLSANQLGWLAATVLDLASHRLDAWITGVATHLLRERRAARPDGLAIGGYGFVTNLAPKAGAPSTGYVYAPSMTHATTAAILRSGYLSHGEGQLAVDLSSRRVRGAMNAIAAIGQGQSLAGYLGQQLERGLHRHRLDGYLKAVREAAPLGVGVLTPLSPGAKASDVAGMIRTDGTRLLAMRDDGSLWSAPGVPVESSPEGKLMSGLLDELADAVDAISDIGVAESVHQTIQRNQIRAAAALDSVTRGDAPLPADPDVLRIPRPGVGVTHRVLINAPAAGSRPPSGWESTPRALAEPRLNAWVAAALPNPGSVYWSATYLDPDGNAVGSDDFVLSAVGLCPLDLLTLASPGAGDAASSELGRRLVLHASDNGPHRANGTTVRLNLDSKAGRSPSLSVLEYLTVAGAVRSVVFGGRPARSGDLARVGSAREPGVDLSASQTELTGRLKAAVNGLAAALSSIRNPFETTSALRTAIAAVFSSQSGLRNLLDLPDSLDIARVVDPDENNVLDGDERPRAADFGAIRSALVGLGGYGLDGAVPSPVHATDAAERLELARRARAVAVPAARRLAAGRQALTAAAQASDPDAAIGSLIDGMAALFGDGFQALPVLATAMPTKPPAGLTDDVIDDVLEDWCDLSAPVRPAMDRLRDAGIICAATGGAPLRFSARQYSAAASDPWVGLPTPAGVKPQGGTTSIVLVGVTDDWPRVEAACLVLDSWVELIPSASVDTAVTFHLDSPDSRAPQVLLLAVHPDPARPWSFDLLTAVAREAAQLAQVRSIDPDQVPIAHQLVPALLVATNTNFDTISMTVEG